MSNKEYYKLLDQTEKELKNFKKLLSHDDLNDLINQVVFNKSNQK